MKHLIPLSHKLNEKKNDLQHRKSPRKSGVFLLKKKVIHLIIFLLKKIFSKILELIKYTYLCHPKNRGVELWGSVKKGIVLRYFAEVAQLVEQLICNQQVGGSTPFFGSED